MNWEIPFLHSSRSDDDELQQNSEFTDKTYSQPLSVGVC